MDRHCATRRLRRLSEQAGVTIARMHPHMLQHTFVATMLDAGVDLRDVQIAARHADPRTTSATTAPVRTSIGTPTTSLPPTWPPALDTPTCRCRDASMWPSSIAVGSIRCMTPAPVTRGNGLAEQAPDRSPKGGRYCDALTEVPRGQILEGWRPPATRSRGAERAAARHSIPVLRRDASSLRGPPRRLRAADQARRP